MLQIVPISLKLCKQVAAFFEEIKDNKFFHPHPFTLKEAYQRCYYDGDDIYCVLIDGDILGYGMIRGIGQWETPCLGIYLIPKHRGQNYGELLIRFLHAAAKLNGLDKLRLHVSPDNITAILLYGKTGYKFNDERHNGELVGYKDLKGNK